jgi:hypothetical protein
MSLYEYIYTDTAIPKSTSNSSNCKEAAFNYLLYTAHELHITSKESEKVMQQRDTIEISNVYNMKDITKY